MKRATLLGYAAAFCILLCAAIVFSAAFFAPGAAEHFVPQQNSSAAPLLKTELRRSVSASAKMAEADGAQTKEAPVLILMYHQLLQSQKSQYIVTPEMFRQDLRTLKAHGYGSVTAREMIAFVGGVGTLPEKPVLITFDDGHYNNLYYGSQILKEEGFTAVASIIGRFSNNSTNQGTGGNPNYSHLTWDEVREMQGSGSFEIGNHTYDMHNYRPRFGVSKLSGETDEAYREAFTADTLKLQGILTEKSGVTPTVYAFPFGKYSKLTKSILADLGFRMFLTCNEGISKIKVGDETSLHQLMRYNRNPWYDMDAFLSDRDKAFHAAG